MPKHCQCSFQGQGLDLWGQGHWCWGLRPRRGLEITSLDCRQTDINAGHVRRSHIATSLAYWCRRIVDSARRCYTDKIHEHTTNISVFLLNHFSAAAVIQDGPKTDIYLCDWSNFTWDWIGPITLIILFLVAHFNFSFVPCGGLSLAGYPSAFQCTLNTHYRIISYRSPNWLAWFLPLTEK